MNTDAATETVTSTDPGEVPTDADSEATRADDPETQRLYMASAGPVADDAPADGRAAEPSGAADADPVVDEGPSAPATAAGRRPGGFRDEPVRTVVRGIGELLITLGIVLGLFVVYELYITDLFGAQKQAAAQEQMQQMWAADDPTLTAPTSGPTPSAPEQVVDPADRERRYATVTGEGFANIYIPVFGADYVYPIVEGTTTDDLYGKPGHYDDTQYPGELGNFAVAGHRVSKGSPFNALDTLNSCDAIVIETEDTWFVYRVLPMSDEAAGWNPAARPQCDGVQPLTGEYQGVVGREIVDPSDYAQVLPVPHVDASGPAAVAAATQRLVTLTTCHPQFSDAQRMIIHGVLTTTYAKAPGFLPPELAET